jgi:multidrug resistance efflux pump
MAFDKSQEAALKEAVNRMNEDRRRIRLIEQNIDRVESSINSIEHTALSQASDLKIEIERLSQKLAEMSSRMDVMEAEVVRVGKLTGKAATKLELKQLESFIDLVNPITSKFVTKDELDRALEERTGAKTKI